MESMTIKLSELCDLLDTDGNRINPSSRTRNIGPLKASIQKHGLLTPLTVGPKGGNDKYPLISGYRRCAALRSLKQSEVAVQVVSGVDMYLLLAAANIQNPLTPLQQAHQAAQLKTMGYKTAQIVVALGISRRGLSLRFSLLSADRVIQRLVDSGKMSWSGFDRLRREGKVKQVEIVERAKEKSRGTAKADGRVTANVIQAAKKDIKDEANGTPFAGDEVSIVQKLHAIESALREVVMLAPFSDGEKLRINYRLDAIQGYLDSLKEKAE